MVSFNSLFIRVKNTINNGGLSENIFFLHIPKCGGRSIETAIKSCYLTLDVRKDRHLVRHDSQASAKVGDILFGLNYTYGDPNDLQEVKFRAEQLAYYMGLKNVKYISGHLPFNDKVYKEFNKRFKYITILRDPVKRWISHYFYVRHRQSDRWIIEEDFMSYLKSDQAKSIGHDYVKYLGGAREHSDYASKDAIESAIANLHKFEIVGFLEYLDHFVESFRECFGICLKIQKKNQSPVSNSFRNRLVTEEIEEIIQDICKPDIEVYKYAKENFLYEIGVSEMVRSLT